MVKIHMTFWKRYKLHWSMQKDVKSNVKVYDKELTEEIYHENNIIKDLKKV